MMVKPQKPWPKPTGFDSPTLDPLQTLRRAEAELGVQIAEMQGALAGMVVQHSHIRHALAGLENAALPRTAAAESWQELCERVYAQMLAAGPPR
jgi:hypothetical protein